MFGSLLRVYCRSLLHSMFAFSGKKKKHPILLKMLIGLGLLYVTAAVMLTVCLLFTAAAEQFLDSGHTEVYFYFAALFAFGLSLFGSVFAAQSVLFEAKDNDLLLSMPIPPRYIVGVRLAVLWLLNAACCGAVFLPALFVFGLYAPPNLPALLGAMGASLLFPLLTLWVCCLLAWGLAAVTAGRRHKKLLQTVLTLALAVSYMVMVINSPSLFTLISQSSNTLARLGERIAPLRWFGAAAEGQWGYLLLFAALALIPMAAVALLLNKSFLHIALKQTVTRRKEVGAADFRVADGRRAMVKKEVTKFFTTPNYLINCGFGGIMAVLFGVFFAIKGGDLLIAVPVGSGNGAAVFLAGMILFCVGTVNTTAVSLSLEGGAFYVLRSMPLAAENILTAKIESNLILGALPAVLGAVLGQIRLDLSPICRLLCVLLPLSGLWFSTVVGLRLNLRFPRLDFTNEYVVIKQSISVLLTMLVALGSTALFLGLFITLSFTVPVSPTLWLGGGTALFAALGTILYLTMVQKGERTLSAL